MSLSQTTLAALDWAEDGFAVFPCNEDKRPIPTDGFYAASKDPAKIKLMFEGAGDCLIGMRTGVESGVFVLDFDLYKAGASDYMQYLIEKGLLDETQTHTTRSGGVHMLYSSDTTFPNVNPNAGVEVKGEGGYVIVPPSAGYAVASEGIAYASQALLLELANAKKSSSTSTVDALKQAVLKGEDFHDPLAQIAARRSAQSWPVEKVQKELLDLLAASVASNPSHERHARWKDLIEDKGGELSRIVSTGNDKYNPDAHIEKAKERVTAPKLDGFIGVGAGLFGTSSASENQQSDEYLDGTKNKQIPQWGIDAWPFENDGYFSQEDREIFDQEYVAYPLFAERETVLIAAEPKAGKTAIALKLSMAVAMGEDLGPDFKVEKPRPVLYFTLEGARAVEMRVRAELDDRKNRGLDNVERDMLYVVDRPHNFATPDIRDANGAKIVLHNEMCKQEWGTDLGLIVIDTLTKAMPGKDQNSVEDTSELFELIGFLRNAGVKATIVFIHHLSKQGGVRGSTNIEAEVDVVLGVTKDKKAGLVYMDVRRARSMDEEIGYAFKFESHFLGNTKQGHALHAPIVRCVVPEAETVGQDAASAARFAKCMDALTGLGAGVHAVADVVLALAAVTTITPPRGKRPSYETRAITDTLEQVFMGKTSWTYGNYILRVNKNGSIITSVTILKAE